MINIPEVIDDERIAAVLRPFVRASGPVLRAMRESDPLRLRGALSPRVRHGHVPGAEEHGRVGPRRLRELRQRLNESEIPGSAAWDAMTVRQRCDWWSRRVGRMLAAIVGLPRFGGVTTSRLPLRNVMGMVAQGLVLVAIAHEHGMDDPTDQVRLIAGVVLGRELSREVAEGRSSGGETVEAVSDDERARQMTAELRHGQGSRPKALARAVWRMARALWEIHSALDGRPQGRFYHEALGSVPIVGVVGGYLGERAALRQVARHGARWIRRRRSV